MTYHGDVPETWEKGGIIPFPKKGDLGKTSNYRGITLTAIAAKIYNRMLLNRIRPRIDPKLRTTQNGFRKDRPTAAQILTIRILIEGIKKYNLPSAVIFVDFKKALDSTHRGKLMEIVTVYGVPEKTVKAINTLYENTTAQYSHQTEIHT